MKTEKMKTKQKKSTKTTLSDRIADALTLKPRADIEDDQVFGTKPQTVSRVDLDSSDSEDETAISDFRKRNVNLLSEISKKYEGQVVSRKDLDNESTESEANSDEDLDENVQDESSDSRNNVEIPSQDKLGSDSEDSKSDQEAESDDYSITKFQKKSQAGDESGDESSDNDSESESGDDENDDEGEGYDISQLEEPMKEDFEHVKKKNLSEDAKKGHCVRNQLLVWEGLLEMRIHLQRCMNTANQMPMTDAHTELIKDKEYSDESNATKMNISTLLDKFLTLQNLLLRNFPETKSLSNKKQDKESALKSKAKEDSDEEILSDTDNEEIPSDTEPEDDTEEKEVKPTVLTQTKKRKLQDYESEISTTHKALKTFRDTSIQKWNEKTRLATASNIKNAPTNTVLQQISYLLSDKEKLLKRTQLKRSEYDIIGYKKTDENQDNGNTEIVKNRKDDDEYIPEIFDDSDFYHQLLRELIECKSADISDPVQLSRQWIALQQMRSKMKRKVDTKATKGRKIKYVVHNQLVNFMAPEKCGTWNDESTTELYNSLFGKMFELNNAGFNGNVGNLFKLN